jgi:anti-sigma factor RsiW
MMTDISEYDLNAYVDNELDAARRLLVEDFLANNPQAAARIMADLGARDALRLSLGQELGHAPRRTVDAAGRLETGLFWRRAFAKARRAATIVFLIGVGWFAHDEAGLLRISGSEASPVPPAFLEDAWQAHRTELVRTRMPTQSHEQSYDQNEIFEATKISMPRLPPGWRVTDLQIFPSHQGASVEASVMAGSMGRVSLFAAHVDSAATFPPTMALSGNDATFYWQSGSQVFAITGENAGRSLRRAAFGLYETMR